MVEAGILGEKEKVELIGGEIVVIAAKGLAHERIKNALTRAFARAAPDGLVVGIENSLQLADDILVEPDVAIMSQRVFASGTSGLAHPSPQDILLLVEIAVSTMSYDRNVKARLCADYGVREFWIIDAHDRETWVHTGPSGESWSSSAGRARR